MGNEPPISADQRAAFASWVAGHRAVVDSNCLHCGKPFRAIKRRRYCSPACRQAAYRANAKAAEAS